MKKFWFEFFEPSCWRHQDLSLEVASRSASFFLWRLKHFKVNKVRTIVELKEVLVATFNLTWIKSVFWNSFWTTGGPLYMRSFFLQFREYATENWPFFWKPSSNLQSSLVFLYANSLYASLFFWSLSLAYNEGHLYIFHKTFKRS